MNYLDNIIKYITLPHLLMSLVIVAAAIILNVFINKGINSFKKNKIGDDSRRIYTIRIITKLIKTIIVLVAVLLILQINGINVTSLIAGLGLASAVIGLALQDTLKDIIMGINIMADKYFSIGDAVRYKSQEGIVVSFNARTTKICLLEDNSVMSISNRNISEIAVLTNLVDIDIGLSYDEDVNKIETVMKNICNKIEKLDKVERAQYKGTQKFNDSSILYKIRFFCDQNYKCDLKRSANRIIQDELAKENIKIPYNQLDIHNVD